MSPSIAPILTPVTFSRTFSFAIVCVPIHVVCYFSVRLVFIYFCIAGDSYCLGLCSIWRKKAVCSRQKVNFLTSL